MAPKSKLTKQGWVNWTMPTRARYFLSRGSYRLSSRNRGKSWKLYHTLPPVNHLLSFKTSGSPKERLEAAQVIANAIISTSDHIVPPEIKEDEFLKWAKDELKG